MRWRRGNEIDSAKNRRQPCVQDEGKTMPEEPKRKGSTAGARWKRPSLAVAAIVIVAGLGWFFLRGAEKPAPPAGAAQVVPAVGVRAAHMKGVSQSFEFVGRIKAVDKVDVRARVEGFL